MKLKHEPGDFIVEEIPSLKFVDKGEYSIYCMTKNNLTTEQAINIISSRFHIDQKRIKYAGTKDRNAITTQYISIHKDSGRLSLNEKSIRLVHDGYSSEPLSLGTLEGNKFIIRLRDCNSSELSRAHNLPEKCYMPSYFDDQRFSDNNLEIGILILRQDFKKACELLLKYNGAYESEIQSYLNKCPNDYVNAIKIIPKKILMLYVHSVQSYIFNKTLSEILKKHFPYYEKDYSSGKMSFCRNMQDYTNFPIKELLLPGFGTENSSVAETLSELKLTGRDFIIRKIPELSSEGTTRECIMQIERLSCEIMDKDIILKFSLKKGAYATIAIKALFE